MANTSAPLRTTDIRVRFRCHECDVAWTDVAWTEDTESLCWVCGEEGSTLRSNRNPREDRHLHLDFQ